MVLDDHKATFGEKMTMVILNAAPILARPDMSHFEDRLMLAVWGFLGTFLAVATDRPGSWKEIGIRFGVGIAVVILFGPYVGGRLGYASDGDALIAVAGCLGAASWYVVGSASSLIKKAQAGGLIEAIIKAKTGLQLPANKIENGREVIPIPPTPVK